jgi:type II secretory pathway component GspD/PulD (secretin)
MMLTRLKIVGVLFLAVALVGTGSGLALHSALGGQQQVQDPNTQVTKTYTDPLLQARQPQLNPGGTEKGNRALEKRMAALEDQIVKLLKEVQSLRQDLKLTPSQPPQDLKLTPSQPPPRLPERGELRIFHLKDARASDMVKLLQEIFPDGKVGATPLRIAADWSTNSLVVSGSPAQLEEIEAMLSRLDENAAQMKKRQAK